MRAIRLFVVLAIGLTPALLAAQASRVTTFAGVVSDSARRPLSNAEVALPGLGVLKTTNEKGEFRIEGVTVGIHRLTVKHIGYGQLDTTMVFAENQSIEWRIVLGRIVLLDSVTVTAPLDPEMQEFETNRARGFGRFLTRVDLAKNEGSTLPTVMRTMGGVGILRTNVGQSFLSTPRGPMSRCPPTDPRQVDIAAARANQEKTDQCLRAERLYYVPDEIEARSGVKRSCYALVFIGAQLMNSGRPTPPFDINSYATEQIEAIEWYEGQSSTPAKYSAYQAQCGVLVLHLRKKK